MVSQPENRLDFGDIMDSGKIFLAKLPEGLLGKENSYLLGALLVSKFQQLAMSRQAQQIAARRDYWIYIDEFANFITPTMAEILSGVRKYRIGLTLAHHELHQLQRNSDVASAVMAHPFTRVVFRVGDDDARKLADGFSFFEAQDFKNLEAGRAIARVERSAFDFNFAVPLPEELDHVQAAERRQEVITSSRAKYGTPRTEIEASLRKMWQDGQPAKTIRKKSTAAPECASALKPSTSVILVPVETEGPELPEPATQSAGAEGTPARLQSTALASLPPTTGEQEMVDREAHKITDSRRKTTESPQVTPQAAIEPVITKETRPEPRTPKEQGKGGAQHTAIQKRIKEAAQSVGYLCTIETQLLGQQSVDVALEKDGQRIACEISITTTVDHEVQNVKKCLDAGFSKVVIICVEEARLKRIGNAVTRSLGSDTAANIAFFLPDDFIAELKRMPQLKETAKTVRGYKVKRSTPNLTTDEQQQREESAIRSIAETMKKRK
jgi:hypothetical protein